MREGKIVLEKDGSTVAWEQGQAEALKTPAPGQGGHTAQSWELRSLYSLLLPQRGPLAPAERRLWAHLGVQVGPADSTRAGISCHRSPVGGPGRLSQICWGPCLPLDSLM